MDRIGLWCWRVLINCLLHLNHSDGHECQAPIKVNPHTFLLLLVFCCINSTKSFTLLCCDYDVEMLNLLYSGASPLLLPDNSKAGRKKSSSTSPDAGADTDIMHQRGIVLDVNNSYMPADDVLLRSEFLTPLDADTIELYRNVLQLPSKS